MTHAQQIKIRIVGLDHISKTSADAKKRCHFSKLALKILPKTGLISEAPNCALTSVIDVLIFNQLFTIFRFANSYK